MKNKQTEFQRVLDSLTPEEKRVLNETPLMDWVNTVRKLFADPVFWQDLAISFAVGVAEGVDDYLNGDYS